MYATMFQVEIHGTPTYYIRALREDGAVSAFDTMRQGLDYFESAYRRSHSLGSGFSAGAILNWMQLKPRVFSFETIQDLEKLLGQIVKPTSLRSMAVFETAFLCLDQQEAAKVYQSATEPHLVPA